MKIQVQWDNPEQTVIRYIFEQGWGWNDLHSAMTTASEYVTAQTNMVNVIMDITRASIVPKGALSQINRAYSNEKPQNMGITVIVAPNAFLSAMVSMSKKIWGDKAEWQLEFVHTIEDAYRVIDSTTSNSRKESKNGA